MGRQKIVGKVEMAPKVWLSSKEAMAYLGCGLDLLESLRDEAQISFSQYKRKI